MVIYTWVDVSDAFDQSFNVDMDTSEMLQENLCDINE